MVMLGEIMLVSAIYGTTMLSVISEITPTKVRGFAVALYAFVMTIIGASLGPLAVGFHDEQHVGHGFSWRGKPPSYQPRKLRF